LLFFLFQGHDQDWIGRNIYCLPGSQVDAFAVGAAISLWRLDQLKRAPALAAATAALAAGLGFMVLLHQHLAYQAAVKWSLGYSMYLLPAGGFMWGYSMINFVSAAVIVLALQGHWTCRLLEYGAVVHVGRISYGLYVLHLPIIVAANTTPFSSGVRLALCAATLFALAELSFCYFEKPILNWKSRFD
jgi:peptidoglycan/LPS O-acetylase OafA/YrhL